MLTSEFAATRSARLGCQERRIYLIVHYFRGMNASSRTVALRSIHRLSL
jgi:hypothetical protein